MSRILTIDLGTSYFKFALVDRFGRLKACYRMAAPTQSSRPGELEIDPHQFMACVCDGIVNVIADAGESGREVQAISFATQTNSFVLLDDADLPLTPIILWPDRRTEIMEPQVRDELEIPEFTATTGIPGVTWQFMVAKLLWLARHSDMWARTKRLCLVSDYLTLLMTGIHVTEAGAASLTGLVDIFRCEWWKPALSLFAVSPDWLPAIERAGADLGPIIGHVAEKLGLSATCRFVVGCLDQYAGAIGSGCVEPGMAVETTGTVLATVLCTAQASAALPPGVFQGPAFREKLFWRMAFGDVSANYLEWYRNQLSGRPTFEALSQEVGALAPDIDDLRLNTAAAMTTPEQVFVGVGAQHSRGHFVRSIMETVAAALDAQVRMLGGAGSAAPTQLRSAGGGAKSLEWLQIKADFVGLPVAATECPEPTSLGAAILAEASLSRTDVRDVAQEWVRLKPACYPDPQRHALYDLAASERPYLSTR